MEEKQLYTQYDINGDYIYYLDKECTKAFSGHIEDYDRGALCMEADVVDGYMNGIHKEYFDNSTQLKQICFYKKMFNLVYIWIFMKREACIICVLLYVMNIMIHMSF